MQSWILRAKQPKANRAEGGRKMRIFKGKEVAASSTIPCACGSIWVAPQSPLQLVLLWAHPPQATKGGVAQWVEREGGSARNQHSPMIEIFGSSEKHETIQLEGNPRDPSGLSESTAPQLETSAPVRIEQGGRTQGRPRVEFCTLGLVSVTNLYWKVTPVPVPEPVGPFETCPLLIGWTCGEHSLYSSWLHVVQQTALSTCLGIYMQPSCPAKRP